MFTASQNTYRLMTCGFVNSLLIEPSSLEQVDELRKISDHQSSAFKPVALQRINKTDLRSTG